MAQQDYICTLAEEAGVLDRVVQVHADLGRCEWPGTRELVEQQAARWGIRFIVTRRKQGDLLEQIESRGMFPGPSTRFCTAHHKQNQVARVLTELATEAREGEQAEECVEGSREDLLDQVEQRGMWPDAKRRYCTSDQKRVPIHKTLTALTTIARSAAGESEKATPVRILSCMGMRAEESPARAKKAAFAFDEVASNGRRHVDRWLALHSWTEEQVWARIRASRLADLVPHAYALGMPRYSCVFCIYATRDALVLAGHHNPALGAEYARVEKKIGHKFRVDLSMAEVMEAVAAGERPQRVGNWKM